MRPLVGKPQEESYYKQASTYTRPRRIAYFSPPSKPQKIRTKSKVGDWANFLGLQKTWHAAHTSQSTKKTIIPLLNSEASWSGAKEPATCTNHAGGLLEQQYGKNTDKNADCSSPWPYM